jgi:hypothetical protein
MVKKFNLLKYNGLFDFSRAGRAKKRGTPKMKGSLKMCMKTKGKKKPPGRVCRCC